MKPTALLGELRAIPEFISVPATASFVAYMAPVGPPRTVLVLPGFINGDTATIALRAFLRSLGHRPNGWGLGVNVGPSHYVAGELDQMLTNLYETEGGPIDLIGWSAGGIFARVMAGHRPEMVRQVVSLGSPVRLDTSDTNLSGVSDLLGRFYLKTPTKIDVDRVPVPSTAIWTSSDGVVPAESCRQTIGPDTENIQVRGSHSGLGANPAVFYAIADRLAQADGSWVPFEPPHKLRRWYPSIENDQSDGVEATARAD